MRLIELLSIDIPKYGDVSTIVNYAALFLLATCCYLVAVAAAAVQGTSKTHRPPTSIQP